VPLTRGHQHLSLCALFEHPCGLELHLTACVRAQVAWEESWWEASDWAGLKELGANKIGATELGK